MKDILLPTSESFPVVSSLVINLDLVQAAMCPEILLPVYWLKRGLILANET